MGWWLDYVARLCRSYHWSKEYVLFDLPMSEGWALMAMAIEQDGWMQFSGVKRSVKGYLGQEIDERVRLQV